MIPTQPFGRTGHMSTRTIFGAAALGEVTQAEADQTLQVLLKYGVNHIDTAASYGESELRIGPWMEKHRKDFFLATKTGERTYQKAREQIRCSLDRLRVDQIDLIQLHYLVDPKEWEIAMGPGGVLEAAIEAREEGLVRFIGVTGHDVSVTAMHKRSLDRFDFDSILLPFNYTMMQNPKYKAEFEEVVAMCKERNLAVQTIKSLARGKWADGATREQATWYAPLTEQAAIDKAVHWVLGRPDVFLNTAGDIHLLPKILDAANRFQKAPSDGEMKQLVEQQDMAPLFV
jgi:aryl-alcohol dehydrogenase-like predicted oxidoreductase